MPVLKNSRHEKFVQLLFEGEPAVRAYELAGYKPHQGNSSRLRWFEMVQGRLAELQAAAAKRSEITVESLMAELEDARQKATDLNQLSAAVRATGEKIKLSGLAVQKIEVTNTNDFEPCETIEEVTTTLLKALTSDIPDAVISPGDEARGRQVWQDLSAIIDDIRARSAKPVTAIGPSQVRHKRLAAERRQLRPFPNGRSTAAGTE
jgi:phage terminase small subunit